MDHDDILARGPQLERQAAPSGPGPGVDVRGQPLVPSRLPETRPTPLQGAFIYLSIVVLFCGVIAISALELGARLGDPIVRIPVLIGGLVLLVVTSDALVRVWRAAVAWLPVNRNRGLFRLVWAAVLAGSMVGIGLVMWVVLGA